MKLWHDYKKQSKGYLGAIIFASVFIWLVPFFSSWAQSALEVQNKIDQKNEDIKKLEAEIKTYQNELNNISRQKVSLGNSIKELDVNKKKLTAEISVTQKKIDKTNLKIQSLGTEISGKEEKIRSNTEVIKSDFRRINETDQASLVATIFSDEDFSTKWTTFDNMVTFREVLRKKIEELKIIKGDLEDTREDTILAKAELTKLRSELADQKKIVEQTTAEKNRLLKQTKNSEANYQKILKENLAKKEAFEKELRDYESELKFILDPKSLPSGGVLSWPLDDVYITQLFGKTSAAKRLYASGSHSGIDFRASIGTRVLAMADGTVLGIGDTDSTCAGASFGKWIYIEYNNGLGSTYGHLSLIKVSPGQKVARGEVVGYSGATGRVTGPHLHVTVYASKAVEIKTLPSKSCVGKTLYQPFAAVNAYLDPVYYLPKR